MDKPPRRAETPRPAMCYCHGLLSAKSAAVGPWTVPTLTTTSSAPAGTDPPIRVHQRGNSGHEAYSSQMQGKGPS